MTAHAFCDETFRDPDHRADGYYQLTAVLLDVNELQSTRTDTSTLVAGGGPFKASASNAAGDSASIVDMLKHAEAQGWHMIAVTAGHTRLRDQEPARQRCLTELLTRVTNQKVSRFVADSRQSIVGPDPEVRNKKDLATVRALRQQKIIARNLQLEHRHDAQEPLLWIPDAVGWAYRQYRLRGDDTYWNYVKDCVTVFNV